MAELDLSFAIPALTLERLTLQTRYNPTRGDYAVATSMLVPSTVGMHDVDPGDMIKVGRMQAIPADVFDGPPEGLNAYMADCWLSMWRHEAEEQLHRLDPTRWAIPRHHHPARG